MALNPKHTWYIAFSPENRAGQRITETFQTEAEAKEFARLKVAEGRTVNAGTINPHVPTRTVSASDIYRWLEMDDPK